MLSEEKIKLMTEIAMFEKREGKKIFPVCSSFKSDYVSRHMLRSFFCYTLCFIMFIVIWCLYSIERFLNMGDTAEMIRIARQMAVFYVAGLFVYLFITGIVYTKRYNYANRGMRVYVAKLKRLDKRYEFQNKTKELAKEGGPYEESSRV